MKIASFVTVDINQPDSSNFSELSIGEEEHTIFDMLSNMIYFLWLKCGVGIVAIEGLKAFE